jgi:predicted MFS family arabinose efflux permease
VPLTIIIVLLSLKYLKSKKDHPIGSTKVDLIGLILITLSTIAVVFPYLVLESSKNVALLFIVSAILLVIFITALILYEKSLYIKYKGTEHTILLDPHFMKNKTFVNGLIIGFLYHFGYYPIFIFLAFYLDERADISVTYVGIIFLLISVSNTISALWYSRISHKFYTRKICSIASSLMLLGFLASTFSVFFTGSLLIIFLTASQIVCGLGCGLLSASNRPLTLQHIDEKYSGTAASMIQLLSNVASSIGITVITSIYYFTEDRPAQNQFIFVMFLFVLFATVLLLACLYGQKLERQIERGALR